ncbi:MAG TPA: hypothetical protein VJ878_04725 [Candidatus Izemoplasmatales bacterium]|nr:hypothetical protein [Candidatus Izemoplasmatales bacterium]
MATEVISIRLDPASIAKARDGLLAKNIKESQINSPGKIVRATFYYGLLTLCDDPKSMPTPESLKAINNMITKRK